MNWVIKSYSFFLKPAGSRIHVDEFLYQPAMPWRVSKHWIVVINSSFHTLEAQLFPISPLIFFFYRFPPFFSKNILHRLWHAWALVLSSTGLNLRCLVSLSLSPHARALLFHEKSNMHVNFFFTIKQNWDINHSLKWNLTNTHVIYHLLYSSFFYFNFSIIPYNLFKLGDINYAWGSLVG